MNIFPNLNIPLMYRLQRQLTHQNFTAHSRPRLASVTRQTLLPEIDVALPTNSVPRADLRHSRTPRRRHRASRASDNSPLVMWRNALRSGAVRGLVLLVLLLLHLLLLLLLLHVFGALWCIVVVCCCGCGCGCGCCYLSQPSAELEISVFFFFFVFSFSHSRVGL